MTYEGFPVNYPLNQSNDWWACIFFLLSFVVYIIIDLNPGEDRPRFSATLGARL